MKCFSIIETTVRYRGVMVQFYSDFHIFKFCFNHLGDDASVLVDLGILNLLCKICTNTTDVFNETSTVCAYKTFFLFLD